MNKKRKWLLGLAGAVLVAFLTVQWLMARVPAFYRQALEQPAEARVSGSKRFTQRASQLAADIKASPTWQAAFTEAEINAWLAQEFPVLRERYADGAMLAISEPRLAFRDGELLLAVTQKGWWFSRVIWMRAALWVPQPGTLAMRIREVKVGTVPLPAAKLTGVLDLAARHLEMPLEWWQMDRDPVALVQLGRRSSLEQLRHVELRQGLIYLATSVPGDRDRKPTDPLAHHPAATGAR